MKKKDKGNKKKKGRKQKDELDDVPKPKKKKVKAPKTNADKKPKKDKAKKVKKKPVDSDSDIQPPEDDLVPVPADTSLNNFVKGKDESEEEDQKEEIENPFIKANKKKNPFVYSTEEWIAFNDQLKDMYQKIQGKKFEEAPKYIGFKKLNAPNEQTEKALKRLKEVTKYTLISPIEMLYKEGYEKSKKISLEKDKCSICQFNFYEVDEDLGDALRKVNSGDSSSSKDPLNDLCFRSYSELIQTELNVVLLDKCSDHFFHVECLDMLLGDKKSFKCPNCSQIYGILYGDQPYGTMKAYFQDGYCEGYMDTNIILIVYQFPDGDGYTGTKRHCYLPNNKEGREILGLLKVAFDRKLTFTVGTSVTTGQRNTTVWNGIHHKTSNCGGPTNFGYPDPTYFNRVRNELAAKGVIPDNIEGDIETIGYDLINTSNGGW
ncbi:MAG: hypothetical protein MJ252_28845 [archaeon]|nr:hypothetical protein [archaeon]